MLFGFEVIDQNNNYSADRKNDGAACSLFNLDFMDVSGSPVKRFLCSLIFR